MLVFVGGGGVGGKKNRRPSWGAFLSKDEMQQQIQPYIMTPGPVSRKPPKLFGPQNHSKISNLTITELFYMKRSSL